MATVTVTAALQFGEDPQVDPNVLSVLPDVSRVLDVKYHGESAWAKAIRIDVEQCDGSERSYFMKVSVGRHGREALKGEFEGTSAIYNAVPGFSPRPLAWGTFASEPDSHFYVCNFYEFVDGALPEPTSFCKSLARLHQAPQKFTCQKFGFHCTTYNGDLPQDNSWFDKWEDFFAHSLRHVLRVREERAGPSDELGSLLPTLFEKVIPRLLRPLETGGRTVVPSLVHGDLWCGNAAVVEETDENIVYDPAAFWGHNEYELGNWRPARNKFTARYFREYQSHIPKSQPEEDFDDRNLLYSMRFNLNASALFPNQEQFLQMVIDDIKLLNEKFKDGYQGE